MAKDEDQPTSSSQPLLDGANDAAAVAEHDETHAAEEGSRFIVQQEIYTHPDRAVRWLISKGALRLGSFKVQVGLAQAEHVMWCYIKRMTLCPWASLSCSARLPKIS